MNEPAYSKRFEYSRRAFIANASALGVASLLGVAGPVAAEPPPEVVAQGTDWRFLNELKKELKV